VKRKTRRFLREVRRRAGLPTVYLLVVGVGLAVFLYSIRSCQQVSKDTDRKSTTGVNITVEKR